ncbi:hypothetical protein DFAR_1880006 [Desulfarculales bacterium]
MVSLVCMLPGTTAYCLTGGALVSGHGDVKKILLYLALGAVALVLASLVPSWLKKRGSTSDLG